MKLLFTNWPQYREGKGDWRKRPLQGLGGRCIKQGNLLSRLPWLAARRVDCCPFPPESWNLYGGLNWAESRIPSRWYQHTIISSLCPWAASNMQKASGVHIPRIVETVRSLWLPRPCSQVNWRSCPLSYLLQQKSFGNTIFHYFSLFTMVITWTECRCQMFDFF